MIRSAEPKNANGTYDVRELARKGELPAHAATLSVVEHRILRANAYELVWPVVFQRLTRRLELNRGHYHCAGSIHRLEPECLDRFHDDVEAAVDDLLRNAKVPIHHLEGWVSKRLPASTIDAYRRRRGERGALQRPRLPGWLAAGLNHDPLLMELALEMLEWAGVETTAGIHTWPLGVWAERRAVLTGDYDSARRAVADDVETVLAAMRARPKWYADYVERPLGHKQAPLLLTHGTDAGSPPERDHSIRARKHEADDTRLLELAAAAVQAMEIRLADGENPQTVVTEVLATVFGPGTVAEELDLRPGQGSDTDEVVAALLADPAAMDRIVRVVLDLLSL